MIKRIKPLLGDFRGASAMASKQSECKTNSELTVRRYRITDLNRHANPRRNEAAMRIHDEWVGRFKRMRNGPAKAPPP